MTTLENQIENLTKKQAELFNSLVKLGDSKELALATVLNDIYNPEKKKDTQIYKSAYYY